MWAGLCVSPEALEPGEAHLVAKPEYEECDAGKLDGDGCPVGQGQPGHRRPLEQGQRHQHQVAKVDGENEPRLLVQPVQPHVVLSRNEIWKKRIFSQKIGLIMSKLTVDTLNSSTLGIS